MARSTRLAAFQRAGALVAIGLAIASFAGCTRTCEDECESAYADCIDRAPPGAARADCAEQHNECLQRCATDA